MAESTTNITMKTDLELEKFNLDVKKHELEASKEIRELIKEQNASADRLLAIISYLNGVKDASKVSSKEGFTKSSSIRHGRPLTGHEVELRNIALIGLKTLAARLGGVNLKVGVNE